MDGISSIAIFDVGKTNKKLILFDEQYQVVYEETARLTETNDEDGFPCEDIMALTDWIKEKFAAVVNDPRFDVKAVNFSGYGASFVFLDEHGGLIPPMYNYLKPYPSELQKKFYGDYGGQELLCRQTASPALGNLNSGLQLYRIKYEKPELYSRIRYALHLPQYISYILSGTCFSELTSIGCHTHLWDFRKNSYHSWVVKEGLAEKFPEPRNSDSPVGYYDEKISIGVGLHDSSAALIPYIKSFSQPFVLLSTGTWCISLNPFNDEILTDEELRQDCLCYLSFQGRQVKASRLFAGYEHEQQAKRIAEHFHKSEDHFKTIKYTASVSNKKSDTLIAFSSRKLDTFKNYSDAYHQLIADIVSQQVKSTRLVLGSARRLFVDGGFSKNPVFMHLLAEAFPDLEVYAASMSQASAIGAALVVHDHWNEKDRPSDIVEIKLYTSGNRP